jgi:hypothetical protein
MIRKKELFGDEYPSMIKIIGVKKLNNKNGVAVK